jgi:hypothetical protein
MQRPRPSMISVDLFICLLTSFDTVKSNYNISFRNNIHNQNEPQLLNFLINTLATEAVCNKQRQYVETNVTQT